MALQITFQNFAAISADFSDIVAVNAEKVVKMG
jgi:hypothetical protein